MATAEDPIEPRVSALEEATQRAEARLDGHDARLDDLHSLASGTDRDVSAIMAKLNAHERSLQALHL